MRVTKAMLEKQVRGLANEADFHMKEVAKVRGVMSHLQEQFTNVCRKSMIYDGRESLSWEEIFFRLGEINADGNIETLRNNNYTQGEEINKLHAEISKLYKERAENK